MKKIFFTYSILFLLILPVIIFFGFGYLKNKEDYDALSGRMHGLQKALLVYSEDHGGNDDKLILPSALNDLFHANYLAKDDYWFYTENGRIEYRGPIQGASSETPLIRGTAKSGTAYWCAAEGSINRGRGW